MGVMLCFVVTVVIYLWSAFVVRYMLKRVGYSHPNFAFVPILNVYAMSDALPEGLVMILDKFEVAHDIYKFWWLISALIMLVPVIGPLVGLILYYGCLVTLFTFYYRFFKVSSGSVIILSLLSAFIPVIFLITSTVFMLEGK